MLSYQQKYQREKVRLGLCVTCWKKKIYKSTLCREHYEKTRIYQKKYQAAHREAQRKRCAEFRLKNPDYFKKWYRENIKR